VWLYNVGLKEGVVGLATMACPLGMENASNYNITWTDNSDRHMEESSVRVIIFSIKFTRDKVVSKYTW
jgi:hypothetical protein